MKDNHDSVKQENKKALPKFILIMVISLVVGMALGFGLVSLIGENVGDALTAAGLFFTQKVAGWLLIALPLVELAACLPIYFGVKKQLVGWDGEDETVSGEIETRMSLCIWVTGIGMIASLFLLAAFISGFVDKVGTDLDVGPAMFFSVLVMFLVGLVVEVILQQRLVDLTKRMNPEKQGSVYDTKFQKKWFESCDEAERAAIGQCAFKAYQAMGRACMVLWMVFALGGMFFDWGFTPAMAVCVIWGVGQSVYAFSCMKLSKPGSPSVY